MRHERIRLRGSVQGAGVRPTIVRVARALGLTGWVKNDGEGVLVVIAGSPDARARFVPALLEAFPKLAHAESLARETADDHEQGPWSGFAILPSDKGAPRTAILPDAAPCPECLAEIRDPKARRFGYAFTCCTQCGPRYTIVRAIPYDRAATTMAAFAMCAACRAEYEDEGDRRFHAEPIACPACGPRLSFEHARGREAPSGGAVPADPIEATAAVIAAGGIVAVRGVGGYHLLCDATNEGAVAELRARKQRPSKPFALLAADLAMIERFCQTRPQEREALSSAAAPIVLLDSLPFADNDPLRVAPGVAPGHRRWGVSLPSTPLHQRVCDAAKRLLVCTSGNVSDEPLCADPDEARARLSDIADAFLHHDRPIARRIDDSVVQLADDRIRVLRRARGFAPAPLALPPGFEAAPRVFAMGAAWKSTMALLRDGQVVVTPHIGDLDSAETWRHWERTRGEWLSLCGGDPDIVAVDLHPDYPSTQAGIAWAEARGIAVLRVGHHHAHVAAAMAEHRVAIDGAPVLGIALDGLGLGEDGASLWGAEVLLAGYTSVSRIGTFVPAPLFGGDLAAREPWRNLVAHLRARLSWEEMEDLFAGLPWLDRCRGLPRAILDRAFATGLGSPLASSAGRLFDAAAAAAGVCVDKADHEGQPAMWLEQAITPAALAEAESEDGYPTEFKTIQGIPALAPAALLVGMLRDLRRGVPVPRVSARFHVSLARAIAALGTGALASHSELNIWGFGSPSASCAPNPKIDTVVLSGGVWQNRTLLSLVAPKLRASGARVLVPEQYPVNDAGIALGQAVIAAARALSKENERCV